MADDYLPDILRGFLAESRSYLAGLRDLTRRSGSPADLAEGYRLLHCVRGAASMLNLDGLAAIAEGGEALLEDAAQGERPLEPEGQARLAQTLDAVERALTELEAGLPPPLAAPEPEPAALAPQVPSLRGSQAGDVMEGFLEEAEELLAAVGNAVRDAERDPAASSGALLEIRRRVHTLKGTAAMVGFGEVARLSHALEDVLEGADGRERIGVVHEAVDLLDDLVHRPDDAEVSSRVEPLVTRLLAGAAPAAAPPEPAVAEPGAAPRPAAPQQEQLRVPLERVETLVRVASELVVQRSMLERVHRELVRHAGELGLSLKRLHGVSDRLETGYEALALAGTGGASGSFLPAGATELPGAPAVVVLGSRGWLPNRDGTRWFVEEVWPAVRGAAPGAKLHLFGQDPPPGAPDDVVSHPAPEESAEAFAPGAILAVPLRIASGVRMKVLEGWARGLPVVATPEALAGLDVRDGREALIAVDPKTFARAIAALHREPETAARLIAAGRDALFRAHDPIRAARELLAVYASVLGGRNGAVGIESRVGNVAANP